MDRTIYTDHKIWFLVHFPTLPKPSPRPAVPMEKRSIALCSCSRITNQPLRIPHMTQHFVLSLFLCHPKCCRKFASSWITGTDMFIGQRGLSFEILLVCIPRRALAGPSITSRQWWVWVPFCVPEDFFIHSLMRPRAWFPHLTTQ
jgi:hypothetical protein